MILYVVISGDGFPRSAGSHRYRHIRAYESKKRAENYAKKLREAKDKWDRVEDARVVEFVPKLVLDFSENE
jgi:hypothetical protein